MGILNKLFGREKDEYKGEKKTELTMVLEP